jgi:hypothetical protein
MDKQRRRNRGMQLNLLDQRPEIKRIRRSLPDGWREEVKRVVALMVEQHLGSDGGAEGTDE